MASKKIINLIEETYSQLFLKLEEDKKAEEKISHILQNIHEKIVVMSLEYGNMLHKLDATQILEEKRILDTFITTLKQLVVIAKSKEVELYNVLNKKDFLPNIASQIEKLAKDFSLEFENIELYTSRVSELEKQIIRDESSEKIRKIFLDIEEQHNRISEIIKKINIDDTTITQKLSLAA
jgi:hypothetical protein